LSTSATGDGHREGQSPECSNKLAVLTGGKGEKNGQQERKKDIATTHQRQNRGVMGAGQTGFKLEGCQQEATAREGTH